MAFKCDNCGSEVSKGENWFTIGDWLVCANCAVEWEREYNDYLSKEGKLDE